MGDYSKMSQNDFDRLLIKIIDEENPKASQLLSIPGIFEILSEEYNNVVLDMWENEQAEVNEDGN